jgi:hypothetical protein
MTELMCANERTGAAHSHGMPAVKLSNRGTFHTPNTADTTNINDDNNKSQW